MQFVKWYAWGKMAEGSVGAFHRKVSELMEHWIVKSPYLSALLDADAEKARDLGGVPLPLVKDLLAATEECIAPLLERRQECVDLQYKDVLAEWDEVMPKWFAYRDGYNLMLEIADEDKCRVKSECLKEFDTPITGAFEEGFQAGLEWSCYSLWACDTRDAYGLLGSHPERRRGYRLAVTHSICPFCGAVYEYDKEQDGKKMSCEACGKDVQIHRGMLIPWQSIEDSCVCVMSLDKKHIPCKVSEDIRCTKRLTKPTGMRCKCGAVRTDKNEDGKIIVGPWVMPLTMETKTPPTVTGSKSGFMHNMS